MPTVPVVRSNSEHLPFSDHVYRFDALRHRPRRLISPWSLHRMQPPFDAAVVGLNSIVPLSSAAVTASRGGSALRLQLADRRRIAAATVNVCMPAVR